jgi:hypothetical protein
MHLKWALAIVATTLTIGDGVRAEQSAAAPPLAAQPPLTRTLPSEAWNCGMPVIQPPPDVDPAFEKKPDDTLTIPIRRAKPLACGR